MAKTHKPKKKPLRESNRCDVVEGERFHAGNDDVFRYNWWEVFCFPYILCTRFWDCCVSLCAGTNQCLVYWMMIQWLVCKITRLTTPDAIIFPYYFYMFCQVILLTAFFVLIWIWFGNTVIIPYFVAFYHAFIDADVEEGNVTETRLRFKKYCFRKGEIFDSTVDGGGIVLPSRPVTLITFIVDVFVYRNFY